MLIIQETETKYKVPKFMILGNVIKYRLYNDEMNLRLYGIPIADCKDVMTYEEMKPLNLKLDKQLINDCNVKDTLHSIAKFYSNLNIDKDIINEILNNTYFDRVCEEWDITDICRKYNISGEEIFIELCNKTVNLYSEEHYTKCVEADNDAVDSDEVDNDVMDVHKLDNVNNYLSKSNLTKLYNEEKAKCIEQNYDVVYFDYIRGQGVKNKFPIDVYTTKFILNMRRFNSRSSHDGYDRLLGLFVDKIKNGIKYDFKSVLDTTLTETVKNEKDNESKTKDNNKLVASIKYNNNIIKDYSELEYYYSGYNWRIRYDNSLQYTRDKYNLTDTSINTYDLEPYYNKYFKDNLDTLDLSTYFKLESINTVSNNEIKETYRYFNNYCLDLNKISIVNLLLFSKSRINYESLDYILELVRIKNIYDYSCKGLMLDNYIVKHYLTENPKYISVEFKLYDERDTDFRFARSLNDKTNVARYFVTLAQEYPANVLNLHNVNMMFLYKENNEYHSNSINSAIEVENYRLHNVRALD